MPEVSRFFGIVIRMYFDDHEPPHFQAIYGGTEAQVGIDPIMVFEGQLPFVRYPWFWNGQRFINEN